MNQDLKDLGFEPDDHQPVLAVKQDTGLNLSNEDIQQKLDKTNPPLISALGLHNVEPIANKEGGPSMLKSLELGTTQGATYNLGDEADAFTAAKVLKAQGDSRDFTTIYKDMKDRYAQKYAEAKETNPWSYGTGQVAGAVMSPITKLIGAGVGLGGEIAEGAGALPESTLLQSAGKYGAEGAAMGGLNAYGDDENIAEGAKNGALVGSALGVAAPIAKGAYNLLESAVPEETKFGTIFNAAKGGEDLGTPGAYNDLVESSRGMSKDLVENIQNTRRKLGGVIGDLNDQLAEVNPEINVSEPNSDLLDGLKDLKENGSEVEGKEALKAYKMLQKYVGGMEEAAPEAVEEGAPEGMLPEQGVQSEEAPETSPDTLQAKDARDLDKMLTGMTSNDPAVIREIKAKYGVDISPIRSPEVRKILGQYQASLRDSMMESAPPQLKSAMQKANSNFSQFAQFQSSLGMPNYYGSKLASKEAGVLRLQKGLTNTSAGPNTSKLDDIFSRLKGVSPDQGSEADQLLQRIKQAPEQMSMIGKKQAAAEQLSPELKLGFGGHLHTGQLLNKAYLQTARVAGSAAKNLSDVTSDMTNFFNYADDKVLRGMGKVMLDKGQPGIASLYHQLADAPENRRRAMLFALLQQPGFRQSFNTATDNKSVSDLRDLGFEPDQGQ